MLHPTPQHRRHPARRPRTKRWIAAPAVVELTPDDPILLRDVPSPDSEPENDEVAEPPYEIVLGLEGTD